MLIQMPSEEEVPPTVFEEVDVLSIDINASGNANCQYTVSLLPSKFADFMNYIIPLIGTETAERSYIESLRNSFARYGLEVRNPTCQVSTGENFEIDIKWTTPSLATWNDNHWTINADWVDNQSAAKETIAEEQSSWVQIRNIAKNYGIKNAQFKSLAKTVWILPENAENIQCPLLNTSQTVNHGGGTYVTSSLYLENVEGRPAVIENSLSLIVTEEEITITPEQLLENYLAYSVHYDMGAPENATFSSSVAQVRLDLKYGDELEEQYSIYSDGSWYSLTPAQVLYYSAVAIDNYNQGNSFSIQTPIPVTAPSTEEGDWEVCWENLSKDYYVNLAQTVLDNIKYDNKAPSELETSIGKMRFKDLLYTSTRILSTYNQSEELVHTITFAPTPAGKLTWRDNEFSAELPYFLLPDTYVLTDTTRANDVLDNIRDNYDNRELAEEICNWTNTNITYGLEFSPPTSDEVLESKKGQCRDYTNVYLALTRTAGIPSRRVSGWVVSEWKPPTGWGFIVGTTPEGKPIASHAWTQSYLPGEEWIPVDATAGRFENLEYEIYQQMEQTWMGALVGYETAHGSI